MKLELSNKDQGIFVFELDKNNYIKFCPERGGVITNWVSDGNEILYFDETRFMDKTKSIRGGIPILFPICGNLNTSNSVFGNGYLQLPQHGFARDLKWQYSFNENEKILCLILNASKKTKEYFLEDREPIKFSLNRKGITYDYGYAPFLWSSKVWRSLDKNFLIPKNKTFLDVILDCGSEFTWYGESLIAYQAIPVYPREQLFRHYHYENQLARHSQELKEKIQLYMEGIDEFN